MTETRRVFSWRWKRIGLAVLVLGLIATTEAIVGIMQIDNAANTKHFSTGQDVVGVTALFVGVGGYVATFFYGVKFWRRPSVAVNASGPTAYNWRPIMLPWAVVAGTTVVRRRRYVRRRYLPALTLVGGSVLPLRFARGVGKNPARSHRQLGSRSMARTVDLLSSAKLENDTAVGALVAKHVPAPGSADGSGRPPRRARVLPAEAAIAIPAQPFPSRLWRLLVIPAAVVVLPIARAQSESSRPFNVVQFALALGAVELVLVIVTLSLWSTYTRALVVHQEWIAWKPRLARRWRILCFDDVVTTSGSDRPKGRGLFNRRYADSTRDPQIDARTRSIRLQRLDATGVRVRFSELQAGAALPLLAALDANPALVPSARSQLERFVRAD